jgi:hypothetical protein
LTHDHRFMEKLEKATGSEARRLLEALPEIRVEKASTVKVSGFNWGHARHAYRWVFTPTEVDLVSKALSQPSAAPKLVELSTKELLHYQSAVSYDPRTEEIL